MKQKCYFSYDWGNKPEITKFMMLFKRQIEQDSHGNIQIIWDNGFHSGENFKEQEKRIFECDSVVIFFTPEYKQSVDKGDDSRGVYREYNYILEAKAKNNIKVMSVLVSGTIGTAITREFKNVIVADFSDGLFYTNKKGMIYVKKSCKTKFTNAIADIIYETEYSARRKEYRFASRKEAYHALFVETEDNHRLPKAAMNWLDIYEYIFTGTGNGIVVGRKGSGKTTLFSVLENYDPIRYDANFKVLRPISAEHIQEEYIYGIYEDFRVDLPALGGSRILSLFWEIYLSLCVIYIVCVEEERMHIRDERRDDFHKATNKLKRELNVAMLDMPQVGAAIFTKSVDLWQNFIKKDILDYSTEISYIPSMVANLTVDRVLERFFGDKLYHKLVQNISVCEKKVLLALDNFNESSEDFRRRAKSEIKNGNTSSIQKGWEKVEFDGMLYRTLVTSVDYLRNVDRGLMSRVAFCIILPQDRVDQISMVDRDFSKRHFYYLSWDAIDLLTLILLRFKVLFDYKLDLNADLVDTFYWVMEKYLPAIPLEVSIDVGNGIERRIGLFQYMLRNSFWRPRDIIKYFAVLYDANNKSNKKECTIDNDTLKALLSKVTDDIITSEFYNEYDKVIYNIEDILDQFRNSEIVLTAEKIIRIIKNFKFEGAVFRQELLLIDKIELLYEIGVLGLIFSDEYAKENNIDASCCFAFNEGMYPFSIVKETLLKEQNKVSFVINPIFQKKYSLKFNSPKVIGDFSWEYLMKNHVRKSAIDRP